MIQILYHARPRSLSQFPILLLRHGRRWRSPHRLLTLAGLPALVIFVFVHNRARVWYWLGRQES